MKASIFLTLVSGAATILAQSSTASNNGTNEITYMPTATGGTTGTGVPVVRNSTVCSTYVVTTTTCEANGECTDVTSTSLVPIATTVVTVTPSQQTPSYTTSAPTLAYTGAASLNSWSGACMIGGITLVVIDFFSSI